MSVLGCVLVVALASAAPAEGNLLRNGDFQDDWQTQLPELKNHHWNYTTEVFNRRDFNPDGWTLSGKWQWRDADKPRGQRRLVLSSPSRAVQGVNWVNIHNSARLTGWPDAGGFPTAEAVRSKNPLSLVRDLTFRVRLTGTNVAKNAVTIGIGWAGTSSADGPLGALPLDKVTAVAPEGTYADRIVEVKLPAAKWLEAARKDPTFAAQGALIPMSALCEIVYADKQAGTVEVLEALLAEPGPPGVNLLPNGGFEQSAPLAGWSSPRKYRYFPPGVYYIFNTWHNSNSTNRGSTVPDKLVRHGGRQSLRMVVPSGDEVFVISDPIVLNQKVPALLEVRAWVKTHQLCMLQIDAEDENGKRLDGFNFIHKSPLSIGTNDWRLVRQVFRPTSPLKSVRLKLCARGMNGYTLGGTGQQPQQNVTGIVWWDEVELFEPESSPEELSHVRKVMSAGVGGPRRGKSSAIAPGSRGWRPVRG